MYLVDEPDGWTFAVTCDHMQEWPDFLSSAWESWPIGEYLSETSYMFWHNYVVYILYISLLALI
jgi:hypothetical protein